MIFRSAIDSLASVFFPAPCRICAETLCTASRVPICASCFAAFKPIARPFCSCCGRSLPAAADWDGQLSLNAPRLLCRLCRGDFYGFDMARSYGEYNEELKKAILLLKFEEVTCLGDWFASRLAEVVAREAAEFKVDVVVPVPLHPDRRRERGYNQAELIARPLARKLHLKQGAYLLMRTRPRPARLVLSRKEHWDSVRGAYATREGLRVDKLRVLLVDDVMTTGATLDSCARALKKAGAASVVGLTVARVVPKSELAVL
jgi:competence protein ComFC